MMTILKMLMLINSMLVIKTKNPVKMSMAMVTMSILMFYTIKILSSSSWFPMIFFLMFMGGILIVFLILSSLSPNEKSMKLKFNLMFMLIIPLIILVSSISSMELKTTMIKWTMQSSYNMEMMMMIILLYFFSFIIMIASKKMTLRSM